MSAAHALRERGELLAELHQIVQAMKNLAFAQLQRIGRALPSQAQACDAVLQAIASLPAQPLGGAARRQPDTWLVIGAERGLCGAFHAQLVREAQELRRRDPSARILVASRRLGEWLPPADGYTVLAGAAGLEEADGAVDAWIAALREGICAGDAWLLHNGDAGLVRRRLSPAAQPAGDAVTGPERLLPAPVLREALQAQALRLLLQAGLLASLQQENRWRLAQMQRAQDHLDTLVRKLGQQRARVRQAEITDELETLSAALPGGAAPGTPVPQP